MTPKLKIEDGIPMPRPAAGHPKSPLRIAFETMQPGQSVMIPRSQITPENIYKLAKKVGVKVATRQVNCEGRRIWRVK